VKTQYNSLCFLLILPPIHKYEDRKYNYTIGQAVCVDIVSLERRHKRLTEREREFC
jgi:hypothetical protein